MKAVWLDFNLLRMGMARMFGASNRHAYWGPLSPLRYGERPAPGLPGPAWVRCKTLLGGICGSDIATVMLRQPASSILRPYVSYPILLGHESVAEVVEAGAEVDGSWVGKRVCVEPTLACRQRGLEPQCRACAAGRFGECENLSLATETLPAGMSIGYNNRTGGSWGESFVAHVSQLVAVPDAIDNDTAILVDPLSCAMHGTLRANVRDDEQVLVVGAGVIGLGVVASLRALGCNARIIVDARHDFQAEAAIRVGANQTINSGRPGSADRYETLAEYAKTRVAKGLLGSRVLAGGFDVVYDCVGSRATIQDALRTARPGGKVVILGTSTARGADWTGLWFRELTVLGSYGRQVEQWNGRAISTYELVLELIANGKLKFERLLTHTFALADYRKALTAVTAKRSSGVIKAAFKF
jgi:threonine 3-dehydrogenase